MLVAAWMFALYWTSSSAISLLPRVHANIRGVLPNLSVYSMSAPNSISPRTHVNLLCSMASEIGVLPLLSTGSTSAPWLIMASRELSEPLMAAMWIGLLFSHSSAANLRLISRPCSKNKLTLSSLSCLISLIKRDSLLHCSKCSRFFAFKMTSLQILHLVEVLKQVMVWAPAWFPGIISLQLGHSMSSLLSSSWAVFKLASSPSSTNYFSRPSTFAFRSPSTSSTCTSSSCGSPIRPLGLGF